ncbi:acyltransferase family protein [Aquimarina pacifica]|uniref:acyltransferase family protein n=1 Tax=Aquimarina pacifica TaxID=1296415 RepID=UPI00046E993D|nr:DUF5009 domain-containing protein [Aquimarina pacifica]
MNKRLIELDILRGLSIFGMILVIMPGDWSHRFDWMNHAKWEGLPISDLIFPAFLFCVGFSMALSFSKKIEKGASYVELFKKSALRSLLLIIIGLFINGFPEFDWQIIRIPGILQRIGICYLIISIIWLFILYRKPKYDILWLSIISLVLLVGYYILLNHIPIPEIGITKTSAINSWPAYIDQYIFGRNHLWIYGKTNNIVTYDPEGFLSSFTASVNVIIGLIIGILYNKGSKYYKAHYLVILGLTMMMIGFLLDQLDIMPIIKKIWTSSFVLCSTGSSILILAMIKLFIENLKISVRLFYPFIVFGANALIAFIISNLSMPLMDIPLIHGASIRNIGFEFMQHITTNLQWASFLYSLITLTVIFFGLQLMYKNKWFIKL